MKKIISLILVFIMALGLTTAAFAVGLDTPESKNVTATYVDSTTSNPVYAVDIRWDDMAFTYTESGEKVWKADSHSYDTDDVTGTWSHTSTSVTVINHSNFALSVRMVFTKGTVIDGVTTDFKGGNDTLAKPVEGSGQDTAESVTGTLTVSGKPTNASEMNNVTLGNITVTIAKAE